MERKTLAAVTLLTLAAGGAGWLLRGTVRADAPTAERSTTGRPPATLEDARPSPRLEELTRQVAALAAEVRALRVDATSHGASLRSESAGHRRRPGVAATSAEAADSAAPPDAAAADDAAAVERLRDRWSTVLDEMEQRLRAHYPVRPDPHTDLVGWSRFDALERARAALDRARDLAALRALADGEFKSTFTWEK